MARKNITPKTVYVPEDSKEMWNAVRVHIGMESDSAVIWNLIQNKFIEIRDGKSKRQTAQETLSIVESIKDDTLSLLEKFLLLSAAVQSVQVALGELQVEMDKMKEALAQHGFDE